MTSARTIDRLVLRVAGGITLAVGVVAALLGAIWSGYPGAVGAGFAAVIVVAFFAIGQLTLGSVLRTNPQMALSVALMIYLVKVGVLLLLIVLFAGTTLFDTRVFAATIIACTLAWTVAEMWIFARTRVLYVEPAGDR